MEITPRELRDVEIREAFRGYHRDDVNELLERAAVTIEASAERIRQLNERLTSAQSDAGRTRETEDILHRTLLLAQRAADDAVAEAQAKARQLLDDAEIQSRRILADAESEAHRRGEGERRRLEQEVLQLATRRDALLGDVDNLTRFEAEYRERLVRSIEGDLGNLRGRASASPGPQPVPAEVELPQPAVDAVVDDERAIDTATSELDVQAILAAATSTPPPAPPAPPAADVPPFDFAAGERETTTAEAIDLRGAEQAADAEVLDDDAFFASLREAVHDDAPLGPRDDDQQSFDDVDDDDRSSFRDVFRRRR